MAIQNINVGNAANDGTGDDLREAFIKINQNFQEFESVVELTGNNLGTAGAEVFSSRIGNLLNFRRLVGQGDIVLTQHDSTISISANLNTNFIISGDSGSLIAGAGINYNILGAGTNTVGIDENTKTITVTGRVVNDLNPTLGASLNANNNNITGVNNFTSTSTLTTNLTLTNINGVNFQDRLGKYITGFNFGEFDDLIESTLDWIVMQVGVDLGTITQPASGEIDLGSFV